MKIALRNEYGYLSTQPADASGHVPWQYRPTIGAWETFDVIELELEPPTPEPTPPPQQGGDAFDITRAVIASADCPSPASLPILATLSEIVLTQAEQGYAHNFPGRDTWPGVIPPGWDGPINHTLWMCEYIGAQWYMLPIKEALGDYCTLGPILTPGQVPQNLTYFAASPMLGYQPRVGELVGFFATTGDTRRMNVQPLGHVGRTNIVTVPFAAGTYRW